MATLEDDKLKVFLSGWGLGARSCDTCCSAAALLYCRSHAAFFCGACDSNIHRHVSGSPHERVWMCEVCEQAPAAVTCKADAAALCTSCDRDIHSANPLASRHERVTVVPFLDSVADAAATVTIRSSATSGFLISDDIAAVPAVQSDADAWLIPNADSCLFDFGHGSQNQEKIQHNGSFAFTDNVVPTQSNCFDIDFSQPNKHHKQIISAFNFSAQPSVSSLDIGVVPDGNTNSVSEVSYTFNKSASNSSAGDGVPSVTTGALSAPGLDREARVLRYREKRKNRKFEKTIRYALRKAYAETRPRIKGRFAKRTKTSDSSEIDQVYGLDSGSTMFAVDHGGYGVVPSF